MSIIYRVIGWVVIIAVVLFLVSGIIGFLRNKETIKQLNQNLKAARDSIRVTTTTQGDTQYNKLIYVASNLKDLQKLDSELANEVKITKGQIAVISKIGAKIVHDTVTIKDSVDTSSGSVIARFREDTTYSPGNTRKLSGITKISNGEATTSITQDEIDLTASTGLVKNTKGDYEIFFRSKYPGFSLTQLDGAYITKNSLQKDFQPKRKRFDFGIQVGYSPIVYDFTKKKLGFENQVTAGIGVTFKL